MIRSYLLTAIRCLLVGMGISVILYLLATMIVLPDIPDSMIIVFAIIIVLCIYLVTDWIHQLIKEHFE